jgi:uncharacterized protein (DUF849 family)
MRKIILTCAVTGNLTRPEQTPHLPISPAQIAESALAAGEAGAAIVHIHVRHPDDGRPSMELAHYEEVVNIVRRHDPALILNLTTGPGGRYVPDRDVPSRAAPGTTLAPPRERVRHIGALRPEICTLDLNTMNSGDQVVMNSRSSTRIMADDILDLAVRPEIELFNAGDAVLAAEMGKQRAWPAPPLYSFVLGVRYGWPASVESILLGKTLLADGAIWTAFGVGRMAFPMLAMSVLLGGHARIGMEDTIYLDRGVLARSNAELCAKARRIVMDLGNELASAVEARRMLGLDVSANQPAA